MTDTTTPGPMEQWVRRNAFPCGGILVSEVIEHVAGAKLIVEARRQDKIQAALAFALRSYVLMDNHDDAEPRLERARAALALVKGEEVSDDAD